MICPSKQANDRFNSLEVYIGFAFSFSSILLMLVLKSSNKVYFDPDALLLHCTGVSRSLTRHQEK